MLIRALALTLLLGLPAAFAADSLDRRWQALRALEASFTQVQRDVDGMLLGESAGEFALQRPGRFRWDYTEPYAQTVVSDGETLWTYEPDLAQATRRPAQAALVGTPAALLADGAALAQGFTITPLQENPGQGLEGWRLTPRDAEGEFSRIDIWMRGDVPVRMDFADSLGGPTEIQLQCVRRNPRLPEARFRFKVPQGVDVVASP